jgi:hypothetical protein
MNSNGKSADIVPPLWVIQRNPEPSTSNIAMKPRICICCGETIAEHGNALSRNPNMCACCSSMADGMEEPSISGLPQLAAEAILSHIEPASVCCSVVRLHDEAEGIREAA